MLWFVVLFCPVVRLVEAATVSANQTTVSTNATTKALNTTAASAQPAAAAPLTSVQPIIPAVAKSLHRASGKPVNVSVYYQTLCPASQHLLNYALWQVYQDLYKDGIVDITLHAYGNAQEHQENGSFKVTCQHGDLECKLNTIANCVAHLYKNKQPGKDVEFAHCLVSDMQPTITKAMGCANDVGLNWDNIHGCSTGLLGYHLQHKEAGITPPHDQIPWVVVNGVGGSEDQEDLRLHLEEIVCQQYAGDKPTPCTVAAEKKYEVPRAYSTKRED